MKLGNHPTMINDCYRISSAMTKASQFWGSVQGLLKNYSRKSDFQEKVMDQQIDEAIANLKEAQRKLEALKKAYKNYIND